MKSILAIAAVSIGLSAVCSADIIKSNPPAPTVTCKTDGLAPNKICVGAFAGMTWAQTGSYILKDSAGVVSDYLVLKNGAGGAVSIFEPATDPFTTPILGTILEDTSVTLPKLFLQTGGTNTAFVQFNLTQAGGNFPEVLKGTYSLVSVPEPATLALVGLGLVGVALSRRLFRRPS